MGKESNQSNKDLVSATYLQYIWHRRGSRNFRQGGPGQSDKKSSDNVFFFFFFSPQLILRKSKGSNIFQGGVQLFPGGGGGGPIAYSL